MANGARQARGGNCCRQVRVRMNHLAKPPAGPDPIRLSDESDFLIGNLDVRPSLREVQWNGHKELLEPRVMQVLVALACAKESVVSRDELIEGAGKAASSARLRSTAASRNCGNCRNRAAPAPSRSKPFRALVTG